VTVFMGYAAFPREILRPPLACEIVEFFRPLRRW
jgi:hypothetical protein